MEVSNTKRTRPRPGETVQRILAATVTVLLEQGASDTKVRRICQEANISRAAFYRYFGSKEELLEALVENERERFDRIVDERTAECATPEEQVVAYFESMEDFLTSGNARSFLEGEPKFIIEHFKRVFPQSVEKTMEALAPAFNTWDRRLGAQLDRKFISELLVRYMLSDTWVPGDRKPREFVDLLLKTIADFRTR